VRIIVCGKREAAEHLKAGVFFDAAVSINDDAEPKPPYGLARVPRVLKLSFHDSTNSLGPQLVDAMTLCTFLQRNVAWEDWLIHCYAGISRSTAAALVLLGMRFGFDAPDLAQRLIFLRKQAWPNPQLVSLCEDVLGLPHRPLSAQVRAIDESTTAPTSLLHKLRNENQG
jgi:predicted protein tyrosine phosphatase